MRPAEYRSTRDPHKGAHWLALGWGIVIALCAFVGQCNTAHADGWYVQAGGGCIKSDQQSNSSELEFGSECGALAAAEGGYTYDLNWLALSVGGEAAIRYQAMHGQNGVREDTTADGEDFRAVSLAVNVRLERHVWGPVTVYGMGGLGGAHVDGLGDSDIALLVQGEGGLRFDVTDHLALGAGYRAALLPNVELSGNSGDLGFHGAVGWLRWNFGG